MANGIALVLGGNGFIGTRLVRRLTASGTYDGVRAVDHMEPREKVDGVEYISHDVRQTLPSTLAQGVSTLYNLAAVHRTPGHPPHEYYETNVTGALNGVALAELSGIERIVLTSSISVYGPSEEIITEQSTPRPVSDYGRSKRLAEIIHQDWLARGPARRLVIVRPGVIFGPGERGNYTALIRALRRGMFFYPGRRDAIKSGGFVDDLVESIGFALAQNDRLVRYNYALPDLSTTEDIVAAVSKVLGTTIRPMTIPAQALFLAAMPFEAADAVGLHNPIHRDRVRKLMHSTRIYPEWLVSRGYNFGVDLEAALRLWGAETGGRFD